MSSDREIQARRRQAIVEILAEDPKVSEQKELVERLRARGMSGDAVEHQPRPQSPPSSGR